MKYLITHGGHVNFGGNPPLTEEGKKEIRKIVVPTDVTTIIVGTGFRHFETRWEIDLSHLTAKHVETLFSPLVGSAEVFEAPGKVRLAKGHTCDVGRYIGPYDSRWFAPWKFVEAQVDGTLFIGGFEFLRALDSRVELAHATLYQLNCDAKTASQLSPALATSL